MSSSDGPDNLVSQILSSLPPNDLKLWLDEDPSRPAIAARLAQLIRRDVSGELQIQQIDLLQVDHLAASMITSLARQYAVSEELSDPHCAQCSVCHAFVESEAAQLVMRRALQPQLSHGKVPEAATDNDKWFGGGPGRRTR